MILGYPVITSDEYAHVTSIENVSGSKKGSKEYEWFGLDQHVNPDTPPAFIWHTANDQLVPVENSLKLAMACSKEKIPFELHVFPEGPHGMSVCNKEVENDRVSIKNRYPWVKLATCWVNRLFDFEI